MGFCDANSLVGFNARFLRMDSKNKALPLPSKTAIFLRKATVNACRQDCSVACSVLEEGTPNSEGDSG